MNCHNLEVHLWAKIKPGANCSIRIHKAGSRRQQVGAVVRENETSARDQEEAGRENKGACREAEDSRQALRRDQKMVDRDQEEEGSTHRQDIAGREEETVFRDRRQGSGAGAGKELGRQGEEQSMHGAEKADLLNVTNFTQP